MAKKFVRGVTGIEDIESYDKTLTNVNDILSDGQDTYVHTKKGKNESYYKLTDSVKTINSTGSTITVSKDENGTVNLNTNPKKVLEHDNLLTDYGIGKITSGNTTKLGIEYTKVNDGFDLNNLSNGKVRNGKFINAPKDSTWFLVSSFTEGNYTIQQAMELTSLQNTRYIRVKTTLGWQSWREQVGDKSAIDALLAQKQNNLTAGDGVSFIGNTISLKVLDQYNGNLNDIVYTCLVKPADNAPNLPTGVAGNGILTVVRIGNVVSQKYHPFIGNKLYIRTCRDLPNTPKWSEWTLLTQA